MANVTVNHMVPGQATGEAKSAKKSSAEGNTLKELSKVPGVLEEGIISFHHREPDYYNSPHYLCETYLLMLPASCRHPVRLLGSAEGRGLPNKRYTSEDLLGSVRETAPMVDDVVAELGPIHPRGCLFKPFTAKATSIVGKGVYVLYYDGEDVRLLTRLYEQHRSCLAEAGRETFGVCKAGDNVMIVGHDLQAMWNKNIVQRAGFSSFSSKPVFHPALLDRKGINFMLCGRQTYWGHHEPPPSEVPQDLMQLLDKAAKEDPSPQDFRRDIHHAMPQIQKLPMELAAVPPISQTPEYVSGSARAKRLQKGTTKKWPTYRIRLQSGRFTMKDFVLKLQLLLFKTCIPEAAISHMEEEAYTKGVTCRVSCPVEDAERYCEVLRRKGVTSTIEPL